MNVNNAAGSRAQYYDRAAEADSIEYNGEGVAPRATTERASYTVPANKKSIVSTLFLQLIRITAAAPGGRRDISITYTPNGGAQKNMINLRSFDNTVAAESVVGMSSNFVMYAGDELTIKTADGSTGGTSDFIGKIVYTEFDV